MRDIYAQAMAHKFNDEFTTQDLCSKLLMDITNQKTVHDRAIATTALALLAMEMLSHTEAASMAIGNNGEWDQKRFSDLGDKLKEAIEMKLEGIRIIKEAIS